MSIDVRSCKRRLLVVTDDGSCGGTARVAYQLAASLRAAFDIRFACPRNDATAAALAELEAVGVVVHRYDVDEAAPWVNPLRSAYSIDRALDLLEASDPDLILTFDAAELFSLVALKTAAKRHGIPYVTVINILLEESEKRFGAGFHFLAGALADAETIVFACEAHRRRLEAVLPENRAPKIVIPNSRPEHFFAPRDIAARERLREEWGARDDDFVCLTTARIEPHKGQSRIAEALALLDRRATSDGVRLVFAGTGLSHHVRELRDEIAALGVEDRVALLGARRDVVDLLDASDAFILPSRSESTSLSIIEAMAKGLPVVATGVDGILELIDESCGLLLPLEDEQATVAIADAIERLKSDADLRARLADAGRKKADRFRVAPTVERYRDLLLKIPGGRREKQRFSARSIVAIGAELDFADPERAWDFLGRGWSISEPEGIWTEGAASIIRLRTDARKGQALRLDFEFAPLHDASWPIQESYVFVDGVPLAFWRMTSPGRQTRSLFIETTSDDGVSNLRFEHCRAASPLSLGLSPDPREIALFFYRIRILDAAAQAQPRRREGAAA